MNKGIIYKTVVKDQNDVTYYIKLEKATKNSKKNNYNNGRSKSFSFDEPFTSKINLTYYVGKVLDFELNIDTKEIISVTDIIINNNSKKGDKK